MIIYQKRFGFLIKGRPLMMFRPWGESLKYFVTTILKPKPSHHNDIKETYSKLS